LSASATGGALALLDYHAPAGFGPPRHLHRNDDEIFLILSRHLVLWTPRHCRVVGPESVVLLPKQIAHTWRGCGDADVHLQVIVAPGKVERFFERIVQQGLATRSTSWWRWPRRPAWILSVRRRATTRWLQSCAAMRSDRSLLLHRAWL
jgi:hypothetical protein